MRLRARFFLPVLLGVFAGSASAANNPVPQVNLPTVPTTAAPGGAGFTLHVYGAGFVATSTVNWNGSARPTTFVSAAHVTAAIPASDVASKGTAFITLSNPAPGGGSSNVVFFSVTNPVTTPVFTAYYPVALNSLTLQASFYNMAVGDFNGDGKLDLALALGGTGAGLVIALGNGDGTFQTPMVTHPTGLDPQSMVVCDLNDDGKLDLIIGNIDGTLTILLGNGDGTFQQKASVSAGGFEFAVGDFNGDGKLDLAVGGLSVLLGNGDGRRVPAIYHPRASLSRTSLWGRAGFRKRSL